MVELKQFGSSRAVPKLPPSRRVLQMRDLPSKGIAFHPNHLRRLWNEGDFPKPFHQSTRRLAWYEDEIDAWLAGKYAEQKIIDERKRRELEDDE
jgi:predicted DNA-binding transcriptional regulator AlpA